MGTKAKNLISDRVWQIAAGFLVHAVATVVDGRLEELSQELLGSRENKAVRSAQQEIRNFLTAMANALDPDGKYEE